MKKKFLNFIEEFIFLSSILISILAFISIFIIIFKYNKDIPHCCELIAAAGVIFTACSAIYNFISNKRTNRLKYAISLVDKFDCKDHREARNFTRAIKPYWDAGKIAPATLAKLIDSEILIIGSDVKKLQEDCGIKNSKALKESLIYLFNYWQCVYSAVLYNAADEHYIMKHLSQVYVSQYDRFEYWLKGFSKNNDNQQIQDLEAFYNKTKVYLKNKNLGFSEKIQNWWENEF